MNFKRAAGGLILSFIFLAFFSYAIFGIGLAYGNLQGSTANSALSATIASSQQASLGDAFVAPQAVNMPEISAKAAISVRSNLLEPGQIIFEKNSNGPLPIASLTKLMTAVVVLDNYDLSEILEVDKVADSQDPMKQDVKLGDKMPVESFLDIMLVGSSNKSAYALSELAGEKNFVGLMNKKAEALGLENTFFADPTGLSSKNISTAGDLARFAEHILKNYPKISEVSKLKQLYVPGFGVVENTDQLLGEIPDIICSKTGFTTAAKGCLLLVVNNTKNNDYLIDIVLGADDRFAEMKKIVNWSSAICN